MNRGEKGDISFSETLSHSYNGKYENIPMIRVSSYGNELIGILLRYAVENCEITD